jgi:hypothetical protein
MRNARGVATYSGDGHHRTMIDFTTYGRVALIEKRQPVWTGP